jgi:hypothetical protein
LLPTGEGRRAPFLATIMLSEVSLLIAVSSRVPISNQSPIISVAFFVNALMLTIQIVIVLFGEKFIEVVRKKYIKLKMRINELSEDDTDSEIRGSKLRLTTTINPSSIQKRSDTISHIDSLLTGDQEDEVKATVTSLKKDLVTLKT